MNAAPLGSSGGNATPSSTRGSYTAAAADGASAAGILSALFGPGVAKAGGASAAGDKRALEAARAAQISLHELVQRLSGCLSALTYELRLALEMSAGVGVSHAYAPAAIAAYLHVGMHRLSALEQRAVIALLKTARTSGCSAGTQSQDALALLTSLQPLFGAGPLAGAGGPEAFGERPLSHRSRLAGVAAATQDPLLGIDLSPEAETALIVLLAAGVTLLVGLLFSDRFEVGTRFRQWRFRRTHRPGA